jgi:diacylglycerol kinase (ATP)
MSMPDRTQPQSFSIAGRLRSITHALSGLVAMLRTQHNAWLHLAATVAAVAFALYFAIAPVEWMILILAIVAVWVAEALNTALEFLCDVASPEFHPLVKQAKDVAAGGVLIAATGALAVGALIFLPRMI